MESRGLRDAKGGPDVYDETRRRVSVVLNELEKFILGKDVEERTRIILESLDKLGAECEFMPSLGPVKAKIISESLASGTRIRILEIGTLFGYSAILMASILPANGHVTTIEFNPENMKVARRFVELSGLGNRIKMIQGDAINVISAMKDEFDAVFIDANKDQYLEYIKLVEPHLKIGGLVIADNVGVFKNNVSDYLSYVKNSGKYKTRTINTKFEFSESIDDAIEVSERI